MKPIRVLHVVGSMNRGGVETWLMHVLRRIDRRRLQMDFLVHTEQPAAYDAEIEALGSRIFCCPYPHNPPRYAKRFLEIVKRLCPFQVVHSHVHHFSGFTLWLGRMAGIPIRIAHSHNDTRLPELHAGFARRLYLDAAQRSIRLNCTRGLAVSEPAAADLFGPGWRGDPRFEIFYCSIDLAPFEEAIDAGAVRADLGLSGEDVVFGHVGSFSPQKNQMFLVDVAAEVLRREPRAKFIFMGDGLLRAPVELRFRQAGLGSRAIFAGVRSDVPRLLRGAVDVGIFPSIHEGLPLAMIEMQAAGLPCLLSANVAEEAVINPDLVERLELEMGASEWARRACALAKKTRYDGRRALDVVRASPFAINHRLAQLGQIYVTKPDQTMALPQEDVIG
jgi:glycosyltransferase involved in cell wall biosynthesis